jgi:hypothetical protein
VLWVRKTFVQLYDTIHGTVTLVSRLVDESLIYLTDQLAAKRVAPLRLDDATWTAIEAMVAHVAFRGMAFSYDHDEIQTLGAVAQSLNPVLDTPQVLVPRQSAWTALRNFFRESACRPSELMRLLFCFDQVSRYWFGQGVLRDKALTAISRYMNTAPKPTLIELNSLCILLEHCRNVHLSTNTFATFDLFTS